MTAQTMAAGTTGHKAMDFETWIEEYRPMQHPGGNAPFGNMMYETMGKDWPQIQAQDPRRVWTLIEHDGWLGIIPGRRFFNRLGYFVTNRPWDDENMEITVADDDDGEEQED